MDAYPHGGPPEKPSAVPAPLFSNPVPPQLPLSPPPGQGAPPLAPPAVPAAPLYAPGPLTYSQLPPAAPASKRKLEGIGGTIGAILLAILKFGAILLKFAGPMLSLVISIVIWAGIFGWAYGIGIVALIAIHELGHYALSWIEGIPAKLPVFLGPLGAVTTRTRLGTPIQAASIALAGPITGTLAAFGFLVAATTGGANQGVLYAIANVGFALTLLNLIPLAILDGAKAVKGFIFPAAAVGFVIAAAAEAGTWYFFGIINPFPFIIGIAGIFAYESWKHSPDRLPWSYEPLARSLLTLAFFATIALCIAGAAFAEIRLAALGYQQQTVL